MKYSLDNRSGKRKFNCPLCGKPKTFTLYIDIETGEYLSELVGICDRINKCGHHKTPKEFLKDPNIEIVSQSYLKVNQKEPGYIDGQFFRNSIGANAAENEDNFTKFLIHHFGNEIAAELKRKYQIGKSLLWPGASVFWQMDSNGKIRTGKIMCYDYNTGRRIKGRMDWVHNRLIKRGLIPSFNLAQCYFGEHLLVELPSYPAAIVESEKTAIICSIYFPELIWLAAGSIHGINLEKSKALRGHKVFLFPDLKGLEIWQKKAKLLRENIGLNVRVFEWLEKSASINDYKKGLDLADYLVQSDYK